MPNAKARDGLTRSGLILDFVLRMDLEDDAQLLLSLSSSQVFTGMDSEPFKTQPQGNLTGMDLEPSQIQPQGDVGEHENLARSLYTNQAHSLRNIDSNEKAMVNVSIPQLTSAAELTIRWD